MLDAQRSMHKAAINVQGARLNAQPALNVRIEPWAFGVEH
jgi:hypothetical protein